MKDCGESKDYKERNYYESDEHRLRTCILCSHNEGVHNINKFGRPVCDKVTDYGDGTYKFECKCNGFVADDYSKGYDNGFIDGKKAEYNRIKAIYQKIKRRKNFDFIDFFKKMRFGDD